VSGLKAAWVAPKKAKGAAGTVAMDLETRETMDDQVALSTRPDFPPSPSAFDCRVAAARVSKANQCNPSRNNKVSCVNEC
jgi:hypothetical protein